MKKLLTALVLVPSLAFALTNSEKPGLQMSTFQTVCLDGKELTGLMNEFKEIPFVRGVSRPFVGEGALSLVIFANPSTQTFSIIEKVEEDLYCILAVGSGFEPVPKEIQDDVRESQSKGVL